jgi:hypothetical protein
MVCFVDRGFEPCLEHNASNHYFFFTILGIDLCNGLWGSDMTDM